jgi:hypothetical protein
VTPQSDDRLDLFATEIGWKTDILSNDVNLTDDWLPRLRELRELYGRVAVWKSDAIGTIEYRENGEKWQAEFKTFVDSPRIWRLYERTHPDPNRPRFEIARRNVDLVWERMGYFDCWPECWKSNAGANSKLRQMVTAPG